MIFNLKKYITFALAVNFLALIVLAFTLEWQSIINLQVAYLGANAVILSSFLSYQKNIQNILHIYDEADSKKLSKKDEKKFLRSKSLVSYFSIYRILAYFCLLGMMAGLLKYQLFEAINFVMGIVSVPMLILIYFIYNKRKKRGQS